MSNNNFSSVSKGILWSVPYEKVLSFEVSTKTKMGLPSGFGSVTGRSPMY